MKTTPDMKLDTAKESMNHIPVSLKVSLLHVTMIAIIAALNIKVVAMFIQVNIDLNPDRDIYSKVAYVI